MSYEEKRVKVDVYGTLSSNSPLLVAVPGVGGKRCRLHKLAAEGMLAMAAAIEADLHIDLQLASAWRPHRWKSRQDYEQTVIKKYGSVAEGRKWLAYSSPHETGLAMDIGVGGLEPSRKTADAQRKTPLHAWLVAHASDYGWHPYKVEPWHWEFPLSLQAYKTGVKDGASAPEGGSSEDDAVEDEFHEE